jgi:hypothetical protein
MGRRADSRSVLNTAARQTDYAMNGWQRRYDESIRRHRAAAEPVDGEDVALIASGCVPAG